MDWEPSDIRASDADRQRVVDQLRRHTRDGRITLDEFSDRVGEVYGAKTFGQLQDALRELPVEAPARTRRTRPAPVARRRSHRPFALRATHLALKALLICIVASMVFGLVMAMLPFLLVAYFVAIRPRQSELKARWHQHRGHRGPGQQHWSGHHASRCGYRYTA